MLVDGGVSGRVVTCTDTSRTRKVYAVREGVGTGTLLIHEDFASSVTKSDTNPTDRSSFSTRKDTSRLHEKFVLERRRKVRQVHSSSGVSFF